MPTTTCPTVRVTEPGRTPLHLLIRRPMDVGRDCDGLLLADAELSRRHLRLSAAAGRLTVQDLNSTNGTQVDGTVLIGPTGVRPGQVVTFGQCRLEVLDGEPGGVEATDERSGRSTWVARRR
jgi:pSer/pThr/pTyr-binding forkhead associated (FHA) protein